MKFKSAYKEEFKWLDHDRDELNKEVSDNIVNISWAAYHASTMNSADQPTPLDICSLLPLFEEEAASVTMIRHSIDVVTQAVRFLNPNQIPVLACDQPLYALAKKIQWNWPEIYGEGKLVIMFGGFHTELAALKALGHWIEGSGWTNALVQAGVTTPGTADSFLKASHVYRTRHAHQVTASALYTLMQRAYVHYKENVPTHEECLAFSNWQEKQEVAHPQFHYWSITLRFQLTILIFVRSLREGDFQLYKEACKSLVPWFFALNHPNYSRWLPIHIRDMEDIEHIVPSVATEFKDGNFVIQKTQRKFSDIPIDQAHEQNNKIIKGDGGAVGLTENSSQLLRWMVSGPEIARVILEFESSQEILIHSERGPETRHHEQTRSIQENFHKQANALCSTIEEMGNPFLETSKYFLVLDSRDIAEPGVVETVRTIEKTGKLQYEQFVKERLDKRTTPLSEPISRNKLALFSTPSKKKQQSNDKMKISSLKDDCSLFSRLYISCQVREGNLDVFFAHENQRCPPSLSHFGKLRSGTKSDLLSCLETLTESQAEIPTVQVSMFDGAALVNMLKPGTSRTFENYSKEVFLPYFKGQLRSVQRIDVVWDMYIPNSLKATTREKRGTGVRRRVKADTRIPGNWPEFLRNDNNKVELFNFLADELMSIGPEYGEVISTKGQNVLCNMSHEDLFNLSPCNQEEADTRLILHVSDAAKCGFTKAMIRTVDTDVVIIAISFFEQLQLSELWISFGVGKHLRYLPIHSISREIGQEKSKALLAFHALTGCDQTSTFANRGKKTAWDVWSTLSELTPVLVDLGNRPTLPMVNDSMATIERYVILMYDRTSSSTSVNEARKVLFTRKGRSIDNIPPSADAALIQHTKRVAYQAGHCWGTALIPCAEIPCPSEWGWSRSATDSTWEPLWTTIPQASESCRQLLKCGCKSDKGCRGRCTCVRAEMLCTALCNCGGFCER